MTHFQKGIMDIIIVVVSVPSAAVALWAWMTFALYLCRRWGIDEFSLKSFLIYLIPALALFAFNITQVTVAHLRQCRQLDDAEASETDPQS